MKKNLILFIIIFCSGGPIMQASIGALKQLPLQVTSSAFAQGAEIPREYGCTKTSSGENDSPPLAWSALPEGPQKKMAQSVTIICEDPDAPNGLWIHWVVFNLHATVTQLPKAADISALGGIVGKNSWGKNTFGGPCPPSGTHRYFFRVYVLSEPLNLGASAKAADVRNAMKKMGTLASGELMGTYSTK